MKQYRSLGIIHLNENEWIKVINCSTRYSMTLIRIKQFIFFFFTIINAAEKAYHTLRVHLAVCSLTVVFTLAKRHYCTQWVVQWISFRCLGFLFFLLVSRISYLAQNEAGRLAHQPSAVLTFKQSFSLLSLLAECALSVHRQRPDNESHLLCAILSASCLFERSLSIGRAISTWICQREHADARLAVAM